LGNVPGIVRAGEGGLRGTVVFRVFASGGE